jgi:dienelactone hydrolase
MRPTHRASRSRVARLARAGLLVAAIAVVGSASAARHVAAGVSAGVVGEDYDLGVRAFPQPGLSGKLSKMPIRLWGTIAAPTGTGPFPVVLVAHGAHGDGCPGEFGTWPCFAREQRNDLGFRYLVRALARAGFVAFAPDLNAAHTGGWGEVKNAEALRFGQVVDATFAELARENRGQKTRFGIPLQGKLDLSTLGVLGHSRGGMNVLEWGKGKSAVRSTFLLAPFFDPAKRIADVPATVALGTCDGDTRLQGAKYFAALRGTPRTEPAYQLTLQGANHNYYNQTLARLKANDAPSGRPGCGRGKQLAAGAQQAWLASVATDHFRVSLLEAAPVSWMQDPPLRTVYGQRTAVRQLVP